MMMKCDCSTTLCAEHQQSFLDILADVPARLATMMVSVAKQSVMGGQGGSPKNDDDRPLPVNIGASDARLALRADLVTIVVRVQHCLGEQPRPTERDIPGVCGWLARLMPRIIQHPEAVDWYHQIRNAYEKTTKAIDLPPERVRAGKCTVCHEVLYTVDGHEKVRCRPCGVSHDVEILQAAELDQVRAYTGTAAEVLRVLHRAEIKIRLTRLTKWADRNQVPFTTDERGRIFTVGDVHDTYNLMESTK
jgi:hypothetical protein